MSDTIIHSALWAPAWFELDQTLVLGERQKYWFFETIPLGLDDGSDVLDFVFFNQSDATGNCSVRYAKVIEMSHPELGPLLKIDADGLDYIFFPAGGEEVVVDAEEKPGTTCGSHANVTDWSVRVKLTDVSSPVGNEVL